MSMSARAPRTNRFYAHTYGVSPSFSPLERPLRIIAFGALETRASRSREHCVPRAFCTEM